MPVHREDAAFLVDGSLTLNDCRVSGRHGPTLCPEKHLFRFLRYRAFVDIPEVDPGLPEDGAVRSIEVVKVEDQRGVSDERHPDTYIFGRHLTLWIVLHHVLRATEASLGTE